jgi:hypothetical protein
MLGDVILVTLQLRLIHIIQYLHAELNIAKQLITSRLREILSDNHTQHLQIIRVRSHRISGDDPTSASQLMRQRKLIVMFVALLETERNEWEAGAVLLGHDDEAELFEGLGEVVCCAREVRHDGAVAVLAEADELVVLADNLGGTLGEVEREGGLVGAEVVDVEDEFFGEIFGSAPDDPAYTGVDESVPVS